MGPATICGECGQPIFEQVVEVGPVKCDLNSGACWVAGEPVHLTRKEMTVLVAVMRAHPLLASRDLLLSTCWPEYGEHLGDGRTLNTHIRRIRQAIGSDLIVTKPYYGYGFQPERNR